MLIYAPQPDAEFAPVFGGLTEQQFSLLEDRLGALTPAVRFLKELDDGMHPAARRFTLKLHRDDRERALRAVQEVMTTINPWVSRFDRNDRELATLLRQLARAWDAEDRMAARLMTTYLCQTLGRLVESLLISAKIEWAVDLWLDGISAPDILFVPPFGLEIRGYTYVGRGSDGSQWREPFEASLRSTTRGPALEAFTARFGDRARLASAAVTRADVAEEYPLDGATYSVRVGGAVPRKEEDLVEWAFEFTKLRAVAGDPP